MKKHIIFIIVIMVIGGLIVFLNPFGKGLNKVKSPISNKNNISKVERRDTDKNNKNVEGANDKEKTNNSGNVSIVNPNTGEEDISNLSSNEKTIQGFDCEKENELFDDKQMYFENIKILYDNFNFSDVEDMKYEIQKYIHQYISKDILDCEVLVDTFQQNGKKYSFNLNIENVKEFKIEVVLKDDGSFENMKIYHVL